LQKIIFITGTDTGVGKTILTTLLLSHLRQAGVPAFALKPFCSGDRADAELLHSLQNDDFTLDQINPYHFKEPLAPLVAARLHNRKITLRQTVRHIERISTRLKNPPIQKSKSPKIQPRTPPLYPFTPPVLLIEGAGGLLAPLGENFNLLDVILAARNVQHRLSSIEVVLVAPNRLGTISHTLLTTQALQTDNIQQIKVVLMDCDAPSPSRITHHPSRAATRSNPSVLAELLSPIPLFCIPNLGKKPSKTERIQTFAKKYKKNLANILA
jgi:dethiobiotin synthetase